MQTLRRNAKNTSAMHDRPRNFSCESLEGRILFALAGTGTYSGTLSSNLSIRKQQLICDPPLPVKGSTSLLYDASKVTLTDIVPGPGYDNFGFVGLIELKLKNGNTVLHPFNAYQSNPNLGRETGYAQVLYKLEGEAGDMPIATGYELIEEAGDEAGVDTHAFFFSLRPGVSNSEPFAYTVYAEYANVHSGNREDGLTDSDGNTLGPDDLTPAVVRSNFKPEILSMVVPASITEGSSLPLSATATDKDSPLSSLTYSWYIGNTLVGTGASLNVPATTLASIGFADDAAGNVKLIVSDGSKTAEGNKSLEVTNVNPTVTLSGVPATAFVGVPISLSALVADPALTDTFSYAWTLNSQPTGTTSPNFSFTPTTGGAYTFTVTVTDDDGGIGTASVTLNVGVDPDTVARAEILPDPAYPGRLALFVWGTKFNDAISFTKSGNNTGVNVGSASLGAFTGFGRLIVRGLAGNDSVQLVYTSASEVLIFGGDGNDTINGGNYQSVLIGGAGDDTLYGGNAKDLVAGGAGLDKLYGGGGDDLLVGERSIYDAGANDTDIIAWSRLIQEWVSGGTLATRQARITGQVSGGLNGSYVLRATANSLGAATLFNDAAADLLDGGAGKNWIVPI